MTLTNGDGQSDICSAGPEPIAIRPAHIPPSHLQQQIWLAAQANEQNGTYQSSMSFRIDGPLDVSALQAALSDLTVRHEPLRTVLRVANDRPYQLVLDPDVAALELQVEDVTVDEADGLGALVDRATREPFDLALDPPFRTRLLRVSADQHILVLTLHHVAFDIESAGLLLRDLSAAYRSRSRGDTPELAPLPLQYADFAIWQRRMTGDLEDSASPLSRDLAYWKRALRGLPDTLELPFAGPHRAPAPRRSSRIPLTLDAGRHAALRAVADRVKVSPFAVLHATLGLVLSTSGSGTDIPIATLASERHYGNLKELVGPFANAVILRTDLSGNPTLRELLKRVNEVAATARSHRHLPFEQLLEEVRPVRSTAYHPLFQVMLSVSVGAPVPRLSLPGVVTTWMEPESDLVSFDLTVQLSETWERTGAAAGIHGYLLYAADRLNRGAAEAMSRRFQLFLDQLLADPDLRLSDLRTLLPDEYTRLLVDLNRTTHPVPRSTVPGLFQRQVGRTPDEVAVVSGDGSLTYAALNARANQLAHYLVALGIGPGDVVAVRLPPSTDLVLALLGIMKSGAAYLPIDTECPPRRLIALLADARPLAVVTDADLTGVELDQGVLRLRPGMAALDEYPVTDPTDHDRRSPLSVDHPAYVIYTSGSTGVPKGVVLPHRAVVDYLAWSADVYLAAHGSAIVHTSPAFDLTVTALYTPLVSGGRVALEPLDALIAGRAMPSSAHTFLKTTPSQLPLLVEHLRGFAPNGELLLGGEPLFGPMLNQWRERYPRVTVRNTYGPTETTVNCTEFRVDPKVDLPPGPIPIGSPQGNVRVFVLDRLLRPVPPGVVGELYISGGRLARGYLNQPGATAQRFVASPFGGPGERMYRTGDLVQVIDGDVLEYVGRADSQLKVNGVRIEPAEVEAALCADPVVADAAVAVDGNGDQRSRLVAYLVPRPGSARSDLSSLGTRLAQVLPSAMIPTTFVEMASLPRTANGKLDRRALPAVAAVDSEPYRPPRTAREEILCALFADVLKQHRVGVEDDFFRLGGHSLLAIRLVSRVRSIFGTALAVPAFFESPTVAGVARRLDDRETDVGPTLPLAPTARPAKIPLSFAQWRLWFLGQLEGPSAIYNISRAWWIQGPLNYSTLAAALRDVVERHETLRTVLPDQDGEPYQRILAPDEIVTDPLVAQCGPSSLAARLAEAARYKFDLATEPPIRSWLFTIGQDQHVLLLVLHHIASDGWSVMPLMRDLSNAYASRARSVPPAWDPLPVQYADYAMWQRQLLGDESDPTSEVSRQLEYWTRRLEGLPDQLQLPSDRPRPPRPSHQGDLVEFLVDSKLHQDLLALGRAQGVTLFMLLHAALAALLSRLGAGNDIPIGTPVIGRPDPALDDLVGFFVNTVVLRTDTTGSPTFVELLARVRDTDLDAFAHQDVPFEKVVGALAPVRSPSRHPLFQVVVTVDNNVPYAGPDLAGLTVSDCPVTPEAAQFDLLLGARERHTPSGDCDGIEAWLIYATDLFDAPTIDAFAARLTRVLHAMVSDPAQRISNVDLLAEDERRRLLVEHNQTAVHVPVTTLPVLFGRQVRATPDRTAVVYEEDVLTYAELDRQSNQLARYLIARGVGPEDVVALSLPRSTGLIVAVWAVLKAGAAYLPVDPEYPVGRRSFMLEDAHPRVIISEPINASHLPDTPLRDSERVLPLSPEHPVYVIYTSGSTGRPKAVVMTGSALVNLVSWHVATVPVGRVAQFAALSFDVAAHEILATTVGGGTLVMPHEEVRRDAEALCRWLARHEVNELHAPNLVLDAVCEAAGATGLDLPTVRLLVQGGEALVPSPAISRFCRLQPERRVDNHYGPTETHLATNYRMPADVDEWPTDPPIGTPIANTRAYVLDAYLQPVPAGVPAELYLAGEQVARGYLRRPGMTAERFVADPYGPPGARMYRTGDLARWRSDGQLSFLGRTDHQVKVRGFRIELGEIEESLREHQDVAQAVVVAAADRPGASRLIAYVVPAAGQADPKKLGEHLAARLPDHMVPSAYVVLDSLPLSPNGKLDRAALPPPDAGPAGRPPRGPWERAVCQAFATALGLPEVSLDDDFFACGGHSLTATRVVNRIRNGLRLEVSLRHLFEARTPAALLTLLDDADHVPLKNAGLAPMPRPDRIPLSSAQFRLWLLNKLDSAGSTYNLPLAWRLRGELDVGAFGDALGDVVTRHESLRTVFPSGEEGPYQQILDPHLATPQLMVRHCDEADIDGLITEAISRPFDVAVDIPVRALLLVTGPGNYLLVLVLHHIAGDGWSLQSLTRDITTAYRARRRGEAPQWPPLPVQYADYSLWHRELLGDENDPESVSARQLAYWRRALSGMPPELALPANRPRPGMVSYQGDRIPVTVPAALHGRLLRLAYDHHCTLFMVLHAGFVGLLTRLGSGTDVPVGTLVAGRVDEALNDLVGFFVNTLVLRVDTSGDPTFRELLARTREVDLAAYAHQDLPFERLVEVLNPPRSTGRHPLFQVVIDLNNTDGAQSDLRLPDVDSAFFPLVLDRAKFELSLALDEQHAADGRPEGLRGHLKYATELFDRHAVELLVQRYLGLLEQVVADPDRRLYHLDMLLREEPRHLLLDLGGLQPAGVGPSHDAGPGSRAGEDTRTVWQRVRDQAHRSPNAVALVSPESGEVTYAALEQRVCRLARWLQDRGVGPDRTVGIVLDRSPELVVAILAVLAAGGAYVPVEPAEPEKRIDGKLRRSGVGAVLTTTGYGRRLATARHAYCHFVDEVPDGDQEPMVEPVDSGVELDHLAYIPHTSGSTGQPKGVMVTHRGIVNNLRFLTTELGLGADDVFLPLARLSFDAAARELLAPLTVGARIVLLNQEETRDPQIVDRELRRQRVTALLSSVPSMLDVITAAADGQHRPDLRLVVVGGEVLTTQTAQQAQLLGQGATMVNSYGPAEATMTSTYHRYRELDRETGAVPIGRPISGTAVFVLGPALELVPSGVTGELYITGEGLARGYLHDPAATAERYVANPFGPPGSRMYRTGDLVRWTAAGVLEFAGRTDAQVKVRGNRIELGEIEAVLLSHGDVQQAVVVVREDRPGDKRLVAYVTPVTGALVDPPDLRAHLASLLPDYMVPAVVVPLETLPTTANGKVDRRGLPTPEFHGEVSGRVPHGPQEELLRELFAEVLGLPEVGVEDNLFEIGGHSLTAARLVNRIHSVLGVEVSLRAVFQNPTAVGVASILSNQNGAAQDLDPVFPITVTGAPPPLFCVHPLSGLSWCYASLAWILSPFRPVYGLQSPKLSRPHLQHSTMEEMVDDYARAVRSVQPTGPYSLLGWSIGGALAHATAARLQQQGESVQLVAVLDGMPAGARRRPRDRRLEVAEMILQEPFFRDGARSDLFDKIVDVAVSNSDAVAESAQPVFHGDLLLFTATRGSIRRADAWQKHVVGTVHEHVVPCDHVELVRSGPLSSVATVLARALGSDAVIGG